MLKRNIIANYAGTAWNALMNLAFVPLYVRYLGTEAYGLVGICAVLHAYLSFFDAGLSPMLTREMARFRGGLHAGETIRSLLHAVELFTWIVGLFGTCLLWLAAPWIATNWLRSSTLGHEEIGHALRIMSAIVGLRFIESIYRGALVGLQQQVTVNLISSSAATVRGVGSAALLKWWSPTLEAFFWWQGAVAVVSSAAFVWCVYQTLPKATTSLARGFSTLRTTWPFAKGMLISSFLVLGLTQTDKVLLSRLLELGEYGQYTLAVTAASLVSLTSLPITQAFYPRLTELHARADITLWAHEFHRAAQMGAVVAGSVGATLLIFADQIMLLWTGNSELAAATAAPLRLLALGNLLNAFMTPPYLCQLAVGWTGISNWMNAISIMLVIPALFLVVPSIGMTGAAAVWMGLNACYLTIGAPLSFRRIMPTEMASWYLRDLALPVVTALTMCVLVRIFGHLFPPRPAVYGVTILTSAVVALTTAAIAAPTTRANMTAIVRSARDRFARTQHDVGMK